MKMTCTVSGNAEFVMPLVKAVQEQQVIIKALQKQVEAARAELPMQIGKQQLQIEALKKQNDTSQQIINELRKRLDGLEKKVK